MPAAAYKLPPLPAEIVEQLRWAEPPPKFPNGFFDSLLSATRTLLDRGLTISQAGDWFIARDVLDRRHRERFMQAMSARLTRLRQKTVAADETVTWRASLAYDSVHAVGSGLAALCGVTTARWMTASSTSRKCARCLGVARRDGVSVQD